MRRDTGRDGLGETVTTIALGIPHTPWVPARAESMARLRAQLDGGIPAINGKTPYREFTERAPNWEWSVKLWEWLHETGADWGMQLQDDVMVAPCFWPALGAMLAGAPEDASIIGLSAVHPLAPEMMRRGHRWYRTEAMVVGWAYMIRRDALGDFLEHRQMITDQVGRECEDVILGAYARASKRHVHHPCPTLCDHDTTIPSSYANDHHSTRRPQVTWRDFSEGSLTDPSWWAASGTPQMLPMPPQRECWICLKRPIVGEAPNGCGICLPCALETSTVGLKGACCLCGKRPMLRGSQKTGLGVCGACLHETTGSIISAHEQEIAKSLAKGSVRGDD